MILKSKNPEISVPVRTGSGDDHLPAQQIAAFQQRHQMGKGLKGKKEDEDVERTGNRGREEALTSSYKGKEHYAHRGTLTSYPHLNPNYLPKTPHPNAVTLWGRLSTAI